MPSGEYRRGKIRVCQRGVGNRDLPPDPASHIGPNGISDMPCPNLPAHYRSHKFKRSRGRIHRICQAHSPSLQRHRARLLPQLQRARRLFNISVFPARSNGMRTPRRGRPYERNADAWVFRKSSAPLLSNSPFHGFTNARYHYGDVKRCGDFDCFVSCFLQFCANCIVMALARLRGSYNRKENPPR